MHLHVLWIGMGNIFPEKGISVAWDRGGDSMDSNSVGPRGARHLGNWQDKDPGPSEKSQTLDPQICSE
jgi:hypothetical protein